MLMGLCWLGKEAFNPKTKRVAKFSSVTARPKTSSWKQQKNRHQYHSIINKEKWQTIMATWILPSPKPSMFCQRTRAPTDTPNSVSRGFFWLFSPDCQCCGGYAVTPGLCEVPELFYSTKREPAALWRKQTHRDSSAIEGCQHKMLWF